VIQRKSREGFEALQAVPGKRFFVKVAIAHCRSFAAATSRRRGMQEGENKPVQAYCAAPRNQRKTLETKQKAALLRHFHGLRSKVSGPYKTGGMAIRAMIESAHIEVAGGDFSARDFARMNIARISSLGLPLAQLLLLSCP
jgi:hypothetical protein